MKKFMLILALLLGGAAHAGEVTGATPAPLSSGSCIRANLLGASISTLTANVTWGAGVGTLTFSVSTDKATNYTTIPTTRTSTPTMTAGGLAEFKVAGYTDLKACYVGSLTPVTLTFYGNGGVLAFSPANPGAIGGSTPAAGTFTTLTATSETLTTPLPVASGGTGAATGGITTVALAAPVIASATPVATGGTLLHNQTYWVSVTARTASGETRGLSESSDCSTPASPSANTYSCVITWAAVPGASSYNVYRTAGVMGSELKITASIGTTGLTYTDTGSATSGALPARNSTADEVHVGIAGTGTSTTAALPATCTNGQQVYDTTASVVKVCASNTWTAIGAGTVTSVAQTAPGEFTVGGSPVTGTGTLALSYTAVQTAGGVVYADGTKRLVTPAGTTGQALLSNGASAPAFGTTPVAGGGTGDTTTGWSSSARPASPDSRNDEFDADSGWTTTYGSCAPSGSIDPFSAFNTAHVYHRSLSYWPGWLAIQSTNANEVCGQYKAITVNTNDLFWTHVRTTMPSSGVIASYDSIDLCIQSDAAGTHLVCAQAYDDNGTPTLRIVSDGAGTTAITGSATFVHTTGADILGLQKIGSTWYALYGTLAQLSYSVSLTNANTMGYAVLGQFNGGGTASPVPGNAIVGFDYFRAVNSATATPW